MANGSAVADIISGSQAELAANWTTALKGAGADGRISDTELKVQTAELLVVDWPGDPPRSQCRWRWLGAGTSLP